MRGIGPLLILRQTFNVGTPIGARNLALVGLLQCGVPLSDALSATGSSLWLWGSYLGFRVGPPDQQRRVSLSQLVGDSLLHWLEVRLAYVRDPIHDPLFCTISKGEATGFGRGKQLRPGRRLSRSYVRWMVAHHGLQAGVPDLSPDILAEYEGPRYRCRCSRERLLDVLKPKGKPAAIRLKGHADSRLVDIGAGEEGWMVLPGKARRPRRLLRAVEARSRRQKLKGTFDVATPIGARNWSLLCLIIECDLRPGEALALTGADVKLVADPEKGVSRVGLWVGSGPRRRRVVLTGMAWLELTRWLRKRLDYADAPLRMPIFCTVNGGVTRGFGGIREVVPGRPLRDSYLRAVLVRHCEEARIPHMSPDALRQLFRSAQHWSLAKTSEDELASLIPME